MASLSSPGLGSGLDINGLITKLMAVEQIPLTKLTTQETSYTAKLSAYGTLNGTLAAFQSAARGLTTVSSFNTKKASVADATVLSTAADSSATAGSYSIEVTALAQAHKLRTSSTFASTTSALGSMGDTLTFDFGTYGGGAFAQNSAKGTKTVTLGSGQNTLSGVRDAINAANIGASATIINDGSGYRLLLTSADTGSANALRIVAGGGLSALAYDATGAGSSNMSQTVAAQDAAFNLDGVSITQSSNTVSNAIEGVTLNLLKTNIGSATTLTVARDTSATKSAVQGFVKAFNTAASSLKTLTAYDAVNKKGAVLQGDATALSVQSQLRSVLNKSLSYASGGLSTLSDIGISFQKDGSISLDAAKLDKVLADTSKDVSTLFAAVGKPTDSMVSFTGSSSNSKAGNYGVRISQVATQGVVAGTAAQATTTTINAANNSLTVSLDGMAVSIALANGTYSNAGLLASLQAAINGNSTLASSGSAVTATMNGTQATAAGSATAGLTINGTNNTFNVTVDGTAAAVTLTNGTYTVASLISEVQSKINADAGLAALGKSVTVTQANGVLTVKSNRYGATSDVSFTTGDGTANLFGVSNATVVSGAGTGTSTISLTSNRYGSASNVNISGGTAGTTLFGAASLSGTAGKDVAGSVFSLAGLTQGKSNGSVVLTATNAVTLGVNDALSVTVDGTAASVTLDPGTYTAAELASHIQSKINADSTLLAAGKAVSVSAGADGTLTIASNNYGTAATVSVAGGTAATAFIGTATSTAGVGTITGLTQGKSTGAVALGGTNVVTATANDALNVTVDGTAVSVTLTAGTYTAAQLATEVQTQINANATLSAAGKSVTASVDASGYLVLTSNMYGGTSSVDVTGGTAATDFVGTDTLTTGAGTATGSGQTLTATAGDANGLKFSVTGGSLGARGTVAFDLGFGSRLDTAISGLLSTAGTITSRTDGINRSLSDIAKQRDVLNKRITDIEARYRKQFNALDLAVSSMQSTSQYLTQQLASLASLK